MLFFSNKILSEDAFYSWLMIVLSNSFLNQIMISIWCISRDKLRKKTCKEKLRTNNHR